LDRLTQVSVDSTSQRT